MKKYLLIISSGFLLILSDCRPSRNGHSTADLNLPAFNKEGHRGTRGLMPENTIPAMKKAVDYDVNTVELDVVFSKDGKVVVSHDVYFNADFTTTPDGRSLTTKEGQNLLLYEMNYDSIRKYDVGLKPYPAFPRQEKIAAYKPLLSELVDSTDAYAKRHRKKIMFNIELKTNTSYDGVKTPPVEEFVDGVMKIVREKKLEDHCYLQSFDFRSLQILHKKYPDITTAVLIGGSEKRSLEEQLNVLGYIPAMYSPAYALVTPELVADCHKKNIKLIPWTVNTVEEMRKLKEMGVDGIITDYPDYFSQL